MQKALFTTAGLLGALTSVNATPVGHSITTREIIPALPENADPMDLKFQPYLDFDTDGCYNTAAIDPSGHTNNGAGSTGTPQGGCRDPPQLENSNSYSRHRCNNGICGIMYEYYFEKDQAVGGSFLGGHRHEWENIVVFVQDDKVIRLAVSGHGHYVQASSEFPADGTHPLVVYHKDGGSTHVFRFANADDISHPENHFGVFYRSPIVGWNGYPDGLREKMLATWPDGVGPKLGDDKFGDFLCMAAGGQFPQFNCYTDAAGLSSSSLVIQGAKGEGEDGYFALDL